MPWRVNIPMLIGNGTGNMFFRQRNILSIHDPRLYVVIIWTKAACKKQYGVQR